MQRLLARYAESVTRRPGRMLLLMMAVAVGAAILVTGLRFESSYLALLPENAKEVKAIHEVRRFTGGTSELVIAIGGEREKRLPFAQGLVKRLNASPHVRWAQAEFPTDFFEQGGLLLLPAERLRELLEEIAREIRGAKAKANPMLVDLEDDDDSAKKASPLAALEKRYGAHKISRTRTTSDGRYLMVMVKPNAASSELAEGRRTFAGIQAIVSDSLATTDARLEVRYAGSLLVNLEENERMAKDLSLASLLALFFAIGLITLVTRRLAAVAIVGVPLVVGVLVTLAVARLLIGHLNLVSGFMVAALVGLGIDFGIHLYLRYLDELVANHGGSEARTRHVAAMRRALMATFKPCLTAATTTSVAFLALIAADFRGFSEYGLIAAVGVMLTLLTTFLLLPALAIVLTGRRPVDARSVARLQNTRPLARPLAWAMVLAGLGFALFATTKASGVRFYNDFHRLKGDSAAVAFDDYITKELGGSLSPALVMVDGLAQARRAESLIRQRIAEKKDGPIERVLSLASLIPSDRERRLVLSGEIHEQLGRALELGDLSADDTHKAQQLYAAAGAESWGAAAVPDFFRSRLMAARGDKYFLLLWPRDELRNDRVIATWAKELDEVMGSLEGAAVSGLLLDENLIAARVISLIRKDGPRVMALAGFAVLLILLLDFRRFDRVFLVGGAVVLGLVSMLGVMVLFDISLNLFNAVVLPTVLGIGIDNAVHLMHSYRESGEGSVPKSVATAGRAALLSSATTAIGFGSAVFAHHLGLQQMGLLALVGIGATFVTATVLLPALLRVLESDRRAVAVPQLARALAERSVEVAQSGIHQAVERARAERDHSAARSTRSAA